MTEGRPEESVDPIEAEVAEVDRDRAEAAELAPPETRRDLLTLYALNLELARTPWRVSEPQLGAMRLQWWADLLQAAETGETPRGNPLVERVAEWSARLRPPPDWLREMIEARLRELDETPMESAAALDAFLTGSAGAVMRLAAWIATGGGADPQRDRIAADLGWAQGAAALLRAIPAHAARERLMIPPEPGDLVPLAEIARGRTPDALRRGCARLAETAREKLSAARAARRGLDPAAAPALLAAWRAEPALRAAQKPELDVFLDFAPESEFRRRARLVWAGAFGW